jgi:hypothetical protein
VSRPSIPLLLIGVPSAVGAYGCRVCAARLQVRDRGDLWAAGIVLCPKCHIHVYRRLQQARVNYITARPSEVKEHLDALVAEYRSLPAAELVTETGAHAID